MQNRYNVEVVDRMFQNFRKNFRLFGGIVIYFCGDFRQIFLVIKGVEFGRIARVIIRTLYL